jgi:hypothetical protein
MPTERFTQGIISVVQEGRFRLIDSAGRCHPFILSASAAIEPADLTSLAGRGCSVRITVAPATGLIAMVATCIEEQKPDGGDDEALPGAA